MFPAFHAEIRFERGELEVGIEHRLGRQGLTRFGCTKRQLFVQVDGRGFKSSGL